MRILFVALTALLSSCVLTVQPLPPAEPAPPSAPPAPILVNSRLGLPAYPGSRILKREEKGDGSSEVQFETGADLERVYAHFHDYLSKAGWSRWTLERKGAATKLEARYQRNNTSFKLELDQEGRSGRYKLGIDF